MPTLTTRGLLAAVALRESLDALGYREIPVGAASAITKEQVLAFTVTATNASDGARRLGHTGRLNAANATVVGGSESQAGEGHETSSQEAKQLHF